MKYTPSQDILELMSKIKPAAGVFRDCVVLCEADEDPVALFFSRLESEGIDAQLLRRHVQSLLPHFDWKWFFTQVGLTQELSFFSETVRRLEEKFLPPLQKPSEVLWLVREIFDGERIWWVEKLKARHFEKLLVFFGGDGFLWPDAFVNDLQESLEILAQRLSGLGLDSLIARRLRESPELQREFLELGRVSFAERDKSKTIENFLFLNGLKGCEEAIDFIRQQSAREGTSLVLTYRLVQIQELVTRLKKLLSVMQSSPGANSSRAVGELFKNILIEYYENTKMSDFLGRNVEILAYQITLLAERTGEHYIANDGKELKAMWWKAIKGAMVVAILVLIKTIVSKVHLPPLFQALTYGSIYATGFVIIHMVGGVLATKQPAMTASTLAAAMDGAESSDEAVENLVGAIIRTLRTQVAALFGNYLFAFPVGVLLVFPFLVAEVPLVGFAKSNLMIEDLHPVLSLSFFYSAVAGVCLFFSGLISGLADNWFDFNQIGDRMEMIFSGKRWKSFVTALRANFGIWTGNIVLGFMLGSMSSIGVITGLPLDIRHVTFASGAFGIGWIHQEHMMPWGDFALIAMSVLMMGLINLAVSFSLSLFVAMKSRRLRLTQGRRLVWLLIKRILKQPYLLFLEGRKR